MVTNADRKTIEIQCILHTQCNLQCKFCFETDNGIRKPTTINIDYIRNLPDEIIDAINPVVNGDIVLISIFLMGGELFSDNISDEVFKTYHDFIFNLRKRLSKEFDINIDLNWVSNGIFTKYDRVEKLLKDSVGIVLSYDPCDRFSNDIHRQMWNNTFNYFQTRNINLWISTVLTKRNINAYIAGDEIFNQIPSNILIENDDYSPRIDYNDHLPNDDDYYNFYKWCIDHEKFNVFHVGITMKCYINRKYISTCTNGFDFVFSEEFVEKYNLPYIHKCLEQTSLSKEEFYGKYSNQILDVNDCLKYKQPLGLNKRGCLYCEYYEYCPKMCWDLILFKDYKITECPIKRVYQYIEDNPKIIDRYKQWEDKYECNKQV